MTRRNANGIKPDKGHLPEKTCVTCGRPFTRRKKWVRDWAQVKYYSDKCRATGTQVRQ